MLNERSVVPYLIERGLLDSSAVLDGGVRVSDSSRRHASLSVITEHGPAYLVKQARDVEKSRALRHEARLYRLFRSAGALGKMEAFVPRRRHYDPSAHILVIDLIRDAENLRDYQMRTGRASLLLARRVARILASLHRHPAAWDNGDPALPAMKPWIFSAGCPHVSLIRDSSNAALQCLKLIQRFAGSTGLLEPLGQRWTSDAVIHGDARLDNWLALPSRGGRMTDARLIDWELAGAGDRCWDLGAVLSDYIATWVLSIPIAVEIDAGRLLALAGFPLEKLQPAIRTFWSTYTASAGLASGQSPMLVKSVEFGALRLVQLAYEICQPQPQLVASVACLMQVAVNMLERPQEAAVHLMGLSFDEDD